MQQVEFQTVLPADAAVRAPPEVAAQVERDQPIRIVMLVPDPQEDREWSALTAEQFLQGYADGDAVYLIHRQLGALPPTDRAALAAVLQQTMGNGK